ncbi:MAG TPA: HPr(Ser) kinase/phosphatase [Candidatus Krumholzibacteria bacterium]|nr:HPr(Ser) kinase/phosphatase [Candidatus Krumholzibacteria bacterium]
MSTNRTKTLTVKQLLEETRELLSLEAVNGVEAGPIPATVTDIHRPGLALAGFMQNYLSERIQILGETEILYLNTRTEEVRREAVERLFSVPLVCIIVTRQLDIPREMLQAASQHGVPLLRTSMLTTPFIHELTRYLDAVFADTTEIHGTLVDVYGVGLLFTGRSGIGKSEIALDLVERGHRLVADDTVHVRKMADDVLIGRGNQHLRHFMEIRGIGIINVQDLFGIRAVRVQKRIEVEVLLEEWDAKKDWNRAGLDEHTTEILGVGIPQVVIPLFSGKNITVISEVIAMNHMLKVYGTNAAENFNTLLIDMMKSDKQTRHYLRFDTE